MRCQLLCTALFALHALAAPSWTATPFNPPSIPLAVRTPYLSTWLPQGQGVALNDAWPTFWAGQTVAWTGLAKVDGQSYSFMGAASVDGVSFIKATQKTFNFTSTQSIFVLSAGPVDLTVTFLSPVESDLAKLSIPLSYMQVSAASTDGATHSVQIYSDVSAEWVSAVTSWEVQWTTTKTDIISHEVHLVSPAKYEEVKDQSQYGSLHYSILNDPKATYQTGQDAIVRGQFLNHGVLKNTQDTFFRAISDSWPVFGLTKDLGNVGGSAKRDSQLKASVPSVLFSIGHIREPAIQYMLSPTVNQDRSLYFWSRFNTAADVISFFLKDYANALTTARTLDAKVEMDAAKISSDYAGIVALSIRQSLAASELTISKGANGKWNTSDVMLFMKEISSDGNMNTVDVVFPTTPIFLYLFPKLGQYLLEPLLRYQASGQYPNKWSIHDMGPHYPRASGHQDGLDEAMPVEESGNMLIMALAFARKTGDNSQLKRYRELFDQWTQFLIEDSLIPAGQLSTDDFAGPLENQTNLAIKGIVGIGAMAEIASRLGDNATATNYSSIAKDYVQKWQVLAQSATGPHLTLAYGQSATWGLAYNLFGDVYLGLKLFPQSVYDMQTAWYKTVINQYGIPLDTRHTYTKTDWSLWTAAIVTDQGLRTQIITGLKDYVANGLNNVPFSDLYDTVTGVSAGFQARPVSGGHLALLIV
ncbi:hypothetical protein B0H17DRAFT_345172 [Mycena rosella]|uniref:DUF1793-domain-containing protein n=1 Tax=Mycena rosella TaxID=1033263 RepID=A0AAD7CTD0_MYCRO|nr:hypothetical protein B0H17DRAFT_345172 [Mycena rosella]